mmetsp:Transcript_30750/g.51793  ORF Transcript_30750/g.51793 Transcript_30750/m.51793 type:complete len:146 (+) Transcript_30750:19-456(+)
MTVGHKLEGFFSCIMIGIIVIDLVFDLHAHTGGREEDYHVAQGYYKITTTSPLLFIVIPAVQLCFALSIAHRFIKAQSKFRPLVLFSLLILSSSFFYSFVSPSLDVIKVLPPSFALTSTLLSHFNNILYGHLGLLTICAVSTFIV